MRSINQYIINEQLSKLKDQRRDITIKRLAYLKYADETKGNKEFKDLYELLFNFLFDESGNVRDNRNLYNYIETLIKDNNGTIPNLPNNGTIETIDKKISALDEIEPATLKKYIKEVEKEANSKEKSGKKSSDDSFENEMKDSELKEKINGIIDTEGFTNILGLESSQKMSAEDKDKLKSKEENKEKNLPDDNSDDTAEDDSEGEGDSTDKEIENFIKTGKMKKPEEDLSDAFLENYNKNIFNYITEEEFNKLSKEELSKLKNLSKEELKEFLKDFSEEEQSYILRIIKVLNEEYDDNTVFEKYVPLGLKLGMKIRTGLRRLEKKITGRKLNTARKDEEHIVKDSDGSEIHARSKKNQRGTTYVRIKNGKEVGYATKEEFLKAKKNNIKNESLENLIVEDDSESGNEEERKLYIEKTMTSLQYIADTEEDPKKKEMCDRYLNFYKKTLYDEDGNIRSYKDASRYYRKNKGKELKGLTEKTGYRITVGYAADEDTQKEWQSKDPKAWKAAEKKTKSFINTQEKEYVQNVTDEDGSIIKPRQKMNGRGVTFVRVKDGKEIGYATRSEYLAAKRRRAEKRMKKESIELIPLIEFIYS